MRIMIVGAGAVGGFLAACLHETGQQVSVVARGAHLQAIQDNGLQVLQPDGRRVVIRLPASDQPATLGEQDIVITTLKAPALPGILPALKSTLRTGTPVITAMNGIFWWYADGVEISPQPNTTRLDPNGVITHHLNGVNSLGMVVHSTNEVIEPGVVQNRSPRNRFVIGGPSAHSIEDVGEALAAMTTEHCTLEPVVDVRPIMWRKLLRNLSTAPLSVLTGAQAYEVLNDEHVKGLARALFMEGAAVATAHGYPGLGDEVDSVFEPGKGARQKPSMSQDVDKGRPMEIDSILRVVQDFARQQNIATPVFDQVLAMVILRARVAGCY